MCVNKPPLCTNRKFTSPPAVKIWVEPTLGKTLLLTLSLTMRGSAGKQASRAVDVSAAEQSLFARQPRSTATPDEDEFPELVDGSQWTLAANFTQGDKWIAPSERIAQHYHPRLDELDAAGLTDKRAERTAPASPLRPTVERKGWAAGLACRPLMLMPIDVSDTSDGAMDASALGILRRQREAEVRAEGVLHAGTHRQTHITDADANAARMQKYVRDGIDPAVLAPFNDAWLDSAMEQVPTDLGGIEPEAVAEMVAEMVDEVQADYFDAVKTSMVDYTLMSKEHRTRLEITKPTSKFELTTFHPSQDPSVAECAAPKTHDSLALGDWHDSVLSSFESVESGLVVNHEGMLTMLELWSNYEPLRLCTLAKLPQVTAMELERFKDMQQTHCERVVQTLKKKWYPSVVDIFRREVGTGGGAPDEINASLLSAASTLMCNQLRALLAASIEQLVQFFEQFETPEEPTDVEPSHEVLHSEDVSYYLPAITPTGLTATSHPRALLPDLTHGPCLHRTPRHTTFCRVRRTGTATSNRTWCLLRARCAGLPPPPLRRQDAR